MNRYLKLMTVLPLATSIGLCLMTESVFGTESPDESQTIDEETSDSDNEYLAKDVDWSASSLPQQAFSSSYSSGSEASETGEASAEDSAAGNDNDPGAVRESADAPNPGEDTVKREEVTYDENAARRLFERYPRWAARVIMWCEKRWMPEPGNLFFGKNDNPDLVDAVIQYLVDSGKQITHIFVGADLVSSTYLNIFRYIGNGTLRDVTEVVMPTTYLTPEERNQYGQLKAQFPTNRRGELITYSD